jgi:hypothetical protein
MENLNGSVESEFEFVKPAPTLGRHEPLRADRNKIIAKEAGKSGYKATVERVQYGTYEDLPACLLTFAFQFWFARNTWKRFHSAEITIRFSEGLDAALPCTSSWLEADDDDNKKTDGPHIFLLVPWLIYGALSPQTLSSTSKIDATMAFPIPGGVPSVTAGKEKCYTETRNERMTIAGRKISTTNPNLEDTAVWSIRENTVERNGIPDHFQAAVVLRWPSLDKPVVARVKVAPQVVFSVRDTFDKLRPRRSDPISFDGRTPKGDPVEPGKNFADESFDWSRVAKNPAEYSVSSFVPVLLRRRTTGHFHNLTDHLLTRVFHRTYSS